MQEWYGWVGRVSWDFCFGVVIGGLAGGFGVGKLRLVSHLNYLNVMGDYWLLLPKA